MEIIEIVRQVLLEFGAALPNIIGALVILFLGWLLAKLSAYSAKKVFTVFKINRYADRINETDFATKANFRLDLVKFLSKAVFYLVLLIAIMAATDVLGMPIVSAMVADLIAYVPRLLAALALFTIGIYLAEFVKKIVLAASESLGINSGPVIANFVFYLIFLTLTISALAQASIETGLITSNLTIILGGVVLAFAIGYGLASKDTMANFIASFYSKNKVKLGDTISLDGSVGKVIAMDSSSITLQTKGKRIVIPLKRLTSEKFEIITDTEGQLDS